MLLIGNGKLVTRDANNTIIENGAVALDGKVIVAVGTTKDLQAKYPEAEFKDARGRLIMPGFLNTHMHYYSTFARGMSTDSPPATMFSEVLEGLWWRMDKRLTLEDVYYSAIGPMIDQIKNGVTTSIDHHASPFAITGSLFKIAEAAEDIGIRSNLCYEVSDRDGDAIAQEGIKENIDFIKHCKDKKDDMIKGMFGLHASMTISDKTLASCLKEISGLDAGFHVHCAEGIEDVADSLSKYKMRVIERWYKNGVLNDKSIAVHCIHVSDAEIEMLAKSNTAIVHNPESNMGNAVGVSPVLEFMAKDILVGLGTDGYTSDMTESYKVANILHKHAKGLPSVGWGEPPKMLFENNRTIIERQIEGKVGVLEAGAYGDVIIVDYDAPTPITKDNINSHILFGISGRQVDTTIVNGKIIMDERKLVNIDEKELMAKSRELAAKFWLRV